jgi:hypothetical protein
MYLYSYALIKILETSRGMFKLLRKTFSHEFNSFKLFLILGILHNMPLCEKDSKDFCRLWSDSFVQGV